MTTEAKETPFHKSPEWLATIRTNRGKFTAEQKEAMARDIIGNSIPVKDAAKKYGTSVDTIYRLLDNFKNGGKRKRRKQKKGKKSGRGIGSRVAAVKNETAELTARGLLTAAEAAKIIGISPKGIADAIKCGRIKGTRAREHSRAMIGIDPAEAERYRKVREARAGGRWPVGKPEPMRASLRPVLPIPPLPAFPKDLALPKDAILASQMHPVIGMIPASEIDRRISTLEADVALIKRAMR